ncbi:hypothetical protein C8F01DRAFT_504605 [Mycena amicta]|nr:hypothetical protein C8F01DRAFT_504605 [Mycena amicta]
MVRTYEGHLTNGLQDQLIDQGRPYSLLLRLDKVPMALLDDGVNSSLRKRPHIGEVEPFSVPKRNASAQESKPSMSSVNSGRSLRILRWKTARESNTYFSIVDHADYHEPNYAMGRLVRYTASCTRASSRPMSSCIFSTHPRSSWDSASRSWSPIRKKNRTNRLSWSLTSDLVPNWVLERCIKHLTPRYPMIAFHVSPNHSFGKAALIQLLHQFAQLDSDEKQTVSVSLATQIWQYIICLIECPEIVLTSASENSDRAQGRRSCRSSECVLSDRVRDPVLCFPARWVE